MGRVPELTPRVVRPSLPQGMPAARGREHPVRCSRTGPSSAPAADSTAGDISIRSPCAAGLAGQDGHVSEGAASETRPNPDHAGALRPPGTAVRARCQRAVHQGRQRHTAAPSHSCPRSSIRSSSNAAPSSGPGPGRPAATSGPALRAPPLRAVPRPRCNGLAKSCTGIRRRTQLPVNPGVWLTDAPLGNTRTSSTVPAEGARRRVS
jgi:hypothetical protein